MEWKFEKLKKAMWAFENEMMKESSDIYKTRKYSLKEARDYLLEVSAKYPKVDRGMIFVYDDSLQKETANAQHQKCYTVKIFALDKQGNPVEISTGRYLGIIIKTKVIDAELAEYMNEEKEKIVFVAKES